MILTTLDVKCLNFLVADDGKVKIADLGCAKVIQTLGLSPTKRFSRVGTPLYAGLYYLIDLLSPSFF
jgi:serine/threonine protein kinase